MSVHPAPPLPRPAGPAERSSRWRIQPPWPVPALLCWASAWTVWGLGQALLPGVWALTLAAGAAAALSLLCQGRWRQLIAAGGFPLSVWALGHAGAMPAVMWLVMLLPLLLAYPLRAWRDAPFFPTPAAALQGLAEIVGPRQRVLDAGCGLGHGLRALQREWPQAQLFGVEWSAPLAAWAAWRCRNARVRRADMWAPSWADYDLVYLFQRPESMARAWTKAQQEMAPGSWLVSLEFLVPGVTPHVCLQTQLKAGAARPVWVYRIDGSMTRKLGR